ncbi:hypothetical protein [Listeria costaricensis]|uniref:hypothetical protein n=1 Tax=Listeria costaricensis TaxID=2026604 RepID=UPI000C082AA5|nr:hypothetical protein [Listeria costaricensis]
MNQYQLQNDWVLCSEQEVRVYQDGHGGAAILPLLKEFGDATPILLQVNALEAEVETIPFSVEKIVISLNRKIEIIWQQTDEGFQMEATIPVCSETEE